jgi:hypothetical protein
LRLAFLSLYWRFLNIQVSELTAHAKSKMAEIKSGQFPHSIPSPCDSVHYQKVIKINLRTDLVKVNKFAPTLSFLIRVYFYTTSPVPRGRQAGGGDQCETRSQEIGTCSSSNHITCILRAKLYSKSNSTQLYQVPL